MLTRDVRMAAEKFDAFIEADNPFLKVIEQLANWANGAEEIVAKIATAPGANEINSAASTLHTYVGRTPKVTREIDVEGFFSSSSQLHELLSTLFPSTEPNRAVDELVNELAALRRLFSVYIAHQSSASALPLLRAATSFNAELKNFQKGLSSLAIQLAPDVERSEDEDELCLAFYSTQTLHSFGEKIKALEDLYELLAKIFRIDIEFYPLRIAKIESGSMWIELIGHAAIAGAIGKILLEAAKFGHRNYTREGLIAGTKASSEQIDAIVATIQKLEAVDVDATEMKEGLRDAATNIALKLNSLMEHESSFVVGTREVHMDIPNLSGWRRFQLQRPQLRISSSHKDSENPLLPGPPKEN